METQIQSNPKITIPANGRVIVEADQYEDSLTDLDEFDLAKIFTPNINMDLSPTPSPDMVKQIDDLLSKGKTFRSLNDKYVDKFIVKGNEELYELLGSIYGFMLTVNESPYRDHIMKRMREHLSEEHSIVLQETAAIESVVVRFVVPSDRQTAFNYARVMKVAFLEKIAAKDLAGYIKGRGGITKIQDTIANEEAAKDHKKVVAKKLSLYKKVLIAKLKATGPEIEVPKRLSASFVKKSSDSACFEFALVTNMGGEKYRINQIVNVPEAVGDQMLGFISNLSIPDNKVDEAQEKLDAMRAKLGITFGYGMEPSDKGYMAPANVTRPPEKVVEEETETKA